MGFLGNEGTHNRKKPKIVTDRKHYFINQRDSKVFVGARTLGKIPAVSKIIKENLDFILSFQRAYLDNKHTDKIFSILLKKAFLYIKTNKKHKI